MTETEEDAAAAADRLEAALQRIAGLTERRAGPAGADAASDAVRAEMAARLDALIAQMRAALSGRCG